MSAVEDPRGPLRSPELQGLRSRYRATLLGLAIGDALGAPFEGRRWIGSSEVRAFDLGADVLRYTDDTHMTIGVAESLIERGGFDGDRLVAHLAARYAAEPWRGYGPGPPKIFRAVADGIGWRHAAQEVYGRRGSFGNGGAMRVAPVALLHLDDRERTAATAADTASVTHAHPLGVEGAVLQALAVRWALRHPPTRPIDELLADLTRHVRSDVFDEKLRALSNLPRDADSDEVVRRLGNGVTAPDSVPAAIFAFGRSPGSFEETIRYAISLGGDTDTIAAMAGAISGACLGVEEIPSRWLDRIEDRAHLEHLADRLLVMRSRIENG